MSLHQQSRPPDPLESSSLSDDDDGSHLSNAFGDTNRPFRSGKGCENGNGAAAMIDDNSGYEEQEYPIPEDRKLGLFSTAALICNRMIGTGIFSTPSTVLQATDSPAASLFLWSVGGVLALCGLNVFLELGTALPRSGGEKVYLERIYKHPKYFATCVYAVQFVMLGNTAGNAISFSKHIIRVFNHDIQQASPDSLTKGISVAAITAICLIHVFLPKVGGRYLNTVLAALKLLLLVLVIVTGAVAGSGKGGGNPQKENFAGAGAWGRDRTTDAPGNWAVALLSINYSYRGWENANYVLGEVREAPRTLRRSAPFAVVGVAILYVLANIAYLAALPRDNIKYGGVTVAADMFRDVLGDNAFVTVIVPLAIAISAFGNVLAVTFANSRVKQELAKEGVLPFSRFWASNKPMGTPAAALFLHWIFSIIVVSAPNSDDAYNFIVWLFSYSQTWVCLFISGGLLYLLYSPKEGPVWRNERTEYHAWPICIVIFFLSNIFLIIAPFIPNGNSENAALLTGEIEFWIFPLVGCLVLVCGVVYWYIFAIVWPRFGYTLEVERIVRDDGTEVVRYKHIRRSVKILAPGSGDVGTGSGVDVSAFRVNANGGTVDAIGIQSQIP